MTADAAAQFAFPLGAGPAHFRSMLVAAGASAALATEAWVANHFRWVVWKLACYERAFPRRLPAPALTPERVMHQLRYRYEREINTAQFPALKQVFWPLDWVYLPQAVIRRTPGLRFSQAFTAVGVCGRAANALCTTGSWKGIVRPVHP